MFPPTTWKASAHLFADRRNVLTQVSLATGYPVPQNIQAYAYYLDSRIRAYKELKHDVVKVQAEANRDMRTSASVEEDGYRQRKGAKPATMPTRSKTIMGRKLRSMTVEKGLLRETKAVQTMIDTLVQCRVGVTLSSDALTHNLLVLP